MVYNNGRKHSRATRDATTEVLALRVCAAAEAAAKSLHAAAGDRKLIHEKESDETERDTLWDIDEVADALHGFASWASGAAPHPERPRVLKELRRLDQTLRFDLPAKVARYSRCKKLPVYLNPLLELRQSLLEYLEAEDRLNNAPHPRRASAPARRAAPR
jgi:hypothetical protein